MYIYNNGVILRKATDDEVASVCKTVVNHDIIRDKTFIELDNGVFLERKADDKFFDTATMNQYAQILKDNPGTIKDVQENGVRRRIFDDPDCTQYTFQGGNTYGLVGFIKL